MNHHRHPFFRAPNRRAFTVVELIVSMAILTAAMIAVAAIFSISSEAAGRTESHVEILEASAAFQQTVTDELSRVAPGLLIIESPPPTLVRAEVSDGPKVFRLRHDRLVFMASYGSEGSYQSFTDPTRGDPANPAKKPVGSPEALIYYGPGIPVDGNGDLAPFDSEAIGLTASEWIFAHRAILLMETDPMVTGWTPPTLAQFDTGLLTNPTGIYESRMDAMISTATELAPRLLGIPIDTPTVRLSDLWSPNLTPISTSLLNSAAADYYTRSGFTFQPRMVDFRIEWTDGRRVDPNGPDNNPATAADNDFSTRWFGLVPDRSAVPDLSDINSIAYQSRMRGFAGPLNLSNPNVANPDNSPAETAAFANIEWSPTGITADAAARYRAVWRSDTWDYRPKALRFTYRIYDATRRLKNPTTVDFNEDGLADPDPTSATKPFVVTRYGQEFSIVVALP